MSERVSWRTLAAWVQCDTIDPKEEPFENHTPHLDNLLTSAYQAGIHEGLIDDALNELRYLKVQHAKLLLDYYCEYNGVPRDAHKWTDDEILEWAAKEYERVSVQQAEPGER